MGGDTGAPKDKGKGKKGSEKTKKEKKTSKDKDVDAGKKKGGGKKDAELEAVEMKRRAILLRSKWSTQVSQLNTEVTLAIQRALTYDDAAE